MGAGFEPLVWSLQRVGHWPRDQEGSGKWAPVLKGLQQLSISDSWGNWGPRKTREDLHKRVIQNSPCVDPLPGTIALCLSCGTQDKRASPFCASTLPWTEELPPLPQPPIRGWGRGQSRAPPRIPVRAWGRGLALVPAIMSCQGRWGLSVPTPIFLPVTVGGCL